MIGEVYDLQLGAYLDKAEFSTITRQDGLKQLTFKGWPLYYFSPDADGVLEQPFETLGDGHGGVFYIGNPDYTHMLGRQSVTDGEDAIIYLVDNRGVSLYRNEVDEENKRGNVLGQASDPNKTFFVIQTEVL